MFKRSPILHKNGNKNGTPQITRTSSTTQKLSDAAQAGGSPFSMQGSSGGAGAAASGMTTDSDRDEEQALASGEEGSSSSRSRFLAASSPLPRKQRLWVEKTTWRRWEHEVENFRVFSRPRSVSVLCCLLTVLFIFACWSEVEEYRETVEKGGRMTDLERSARTGVPAAEGGDDPSKYFAETGMKTEFVNTVCGEDRVDTSKKKRDVEEATAPSMILWPWQRHDEAASAGGEDSATPDTTTERRLSPPISANQVPRDPSSPLTVGNPAKLLWKGWLASSVLILTVAAVSFPDGPFERPHPLVWRLVLGLTLIYWVTLMFILCAEYDQVRAALAWLYPDELTPERWNPHPLPWVTVSFLDSPEYASDCTLSWENMQSKFDVFVTCHFLGWAAKGLMVRNYTLCWIMSVFWEITELFFAYILPNFSECWWDSWVADVLICNGLGIWFGIELCRWLEVPHYEWHSDHASSEQDDEFVLEAIDKGSRSENNVVSGQTKSKTAEVVEQEEGRPPRAVTIKPPQLAGSSSTPPPRIGTGTEDENNPGMNMNISQAQEHKSSSSSSSAAMNIATPNIKPIQASRASRTKSQLRAISKRLKTKVKRKIYLMLSAKDGRELEKIQWEPLETRKRYVVCILMVFVNQIVELNAFILKNIFEIPSPHKLNIYRLLFWALLCLPACRQVLTGREDIYMMVFRFTTSRSTVLLYLFSGRTVQSQFQSGNLNQVYLFAIDETVGRLGTYAWFGLGTALTELLVGLKFGFLMSNPVAPWPVWTTLKVTAVWLACLCAFTTIWMFISRMLERWYFNWRRGLADSISSGGIVAGIASSAREKTE
ncbi:unnamed protein product [Amoebophrya sp. A120]|nr:unnamed protein product [Amoebophrya sp. A120]|eukprot:GSA120T00018802001.1